MRDSYYFVWQVTLLHSCKQRDCSWGLRVEIDDQEQQAMNAREIDKLCMHHLQKSRQLTTGMVNTSFSMDKANVRGLDLSNGIWAMPSNEALELLPQALVLAIVGVV